MTAETEEAWLRPVTDMLDFRYGVLNELREVRTPLDIARMIRDWVTVSSRRFRGGTPVIKDPLALFSAEWLALRFGLRPIVMVRHPAAFSFSLKKLGWRFDFSNLTAQPSLMEGMLKPYAQEIEKMAQEDGDTIDQAALLWVALHHVILRYRRNHPDWAFIRHEDLCRSPVDGFRALFRHLGLPFDRDMERNVRLHSGQDNPIERPMGKDAVTFIKRDSRKSLEVWKTKLTNREVARIRDRVDVVSREFYDDSDWTLQQTV